MVLVIGKRNDEENAKEKLFTYASHVPVNSFKVRTFILKIFMAVSFFSHIDSRASKQQWLTPSKFYHFMYTPAMHS